MVVDPEGLEIPLREYLPKSNTEEFRSNMDYYEKRMRELKAIKERCQAVESA